MKKQKITPAVFKRFKMLCLLCSELNILSLKMQELADKLDEEHPDSLEALSYYEDEIIKLKQKQNDKIRGTDPKTK